MCTFLTTTSNIIVSGETSPRARVPIREDVRKQPLKPSTTIIVNNSQSILTLNTSTAYNMQTVVTSYYINVCCYVSKYTWQCTVSSTLWSSANILNIVTMTWSQIKASIIIAWKIDIKLQMYEPAIRHKLMFKSMKITIYIHNNTVEKGLYLP